MNKKILMLPIILIVLVTISCKPEAKSEADKYMEKFLEGTEARQALKDSMIQAGDTISEGAFATLNSNVPIWSKSGLKKMQSEDWVNAKSMDYKIYSGTRVKILSIKDEWAFIKTPVRKGYVQKENLTFRYPDSKDSTYILKPQSVRSITTIIDGYDVKEVNLKPSPNGKSNPSKKLYHNEKVIIIDKNKDNYKVLSEDYTSGWCLKDFVK